MANTSGTRGIGFPFRFGNTSLPATNSGTATVVDAVRSLLLIGLNEVPFSPDLGTSIHGFVFENVSEIQKVRVAQAVRSIIASKEPRMQVLSVSVEQQGSQQSGISVIVNITYKIADEIGDFSIPLV
jgi:phage baseplate assembly protein W